MKAGARFDMQALVMQQILQDSLRGKKLARDEVMALSAAADDDVQALLETAAAMFSSASSLMAFEQFMVRLSVCKGWEFAAREANDQS